MRSFGGGYLLCPEFCCSPSIIFFLPNESCASLPQRNAQLCSPPISPLMRSALPAALTQTLRLPPESVARHSEEDETVMETHSHHLYKHDAKQTPGNFYLIPACTSHTDQALNMIPAGTVSVKLWHICPVIAAFVFSTVVNS